LAQKKPAGTLTPLELEIMKVLWEGGPASVLDVQRTLAPQRALAYTTVQTMLNLLHRKGKVKRTLSDRAFRYTPTVTRERETGRAMRDVLERFFGGSAEGLVMSLLETRHLTPARLAELQRKIEAKGRSDERD
jgi:predicted transcriptional regulator